MDLNANKCKTPSSKTSRKRHRRTSLCLWGRQKFVDGTQKAQKYKKVINLMLLKFKTFIVWKTLLRKWKDKPWKWRKYSQHFYQTKYLYPEYINTSYKSLINKQPIKMGKRFEVLFHKKRWPSNEWPQMNDATKFKRETVGLPKILLVRIITEGIGQGERRTLLLPTNSSHTFL